MSLAGWEGILADDEKIIWQGRPDSKVQFSDMLTMETLMGLFFVCFALFWTFSAASMGAPRNAPFVFKLFPLFGLIFVFIGLNMFIGRVFWSAYRRTSTHYTLTNLSGYIAYTKWGKQRLDTYPINADTKVTLEVGMPGAVWFAEKVHHRAAGYSGAGKHRRYRSASTTRKSIGFERISDARYVYGLMRDTIRDQAEKNNNGAGS